MDPHFLCLCLLSFCLKHTSQLIYLVIHIHTQLSAFRGKPCVCVSEIGQLPLATNSNHISILPLTPLLLINYMLSFKRQAWFLPTCSDNRFRDKSQSLVWWLMQGGQDTKILHSRFSTICKRLTRHSWVFLPNNMLHRRLGIEFLHRL